MYVVQDLTAAPMLASVLSSPAVEGAFLRVPWNQIEPASGRFDFGALDQEIARITGAGKRYTLGVMAGNFTPGWVYASGARSLNFVVDPHQGRGNDCMHITVPVPWDGAYLSTLDAMIGAVGAHIRSSPIASSALTQVKVEGINEYTAEIRMPQETSIESRSCPISDAPTEWRAAGYRTGLVEQAWVHMLDSWATAFPGLPLGADLIPTAFPDLDANGNPSPNAGDALTVRLIQDGLQRFGHRFAVQSNALEDGSGTVKYIDAAWHSGATVGYQVAEDKFGNPACPGVPREKNRAVDPCDPAALQSALQQGVAHGMTYVEVFTGTVAAYSRELFPVQSHMTAT